MPQWRFEGPFHAHHITDYVRCSGGFYLKQALGEKPEHASPKMLYGSALHRAIRMFHENGNARDGGMMGLLTEAWTVEEKRLEDEGVPVLWSDTDGRAEMLAEGETILAYYARANVGCEVVLAEAEFEVEIAGYPFAGRIDQVRIQDAPDGPEMWLVDFKLGTQSPKQIELDLSYQLSIYTLALMRGAFASCQPSLFPDRICYYALRDHLPLKRKSVRNGVERQPGEERGPAMYFTSRSMEDILVAEQNIGRVCAAIRRNEFFPEPGPMSCGMCHVQEACKAHIAPDQLSASERRRLVSALGEEDE